MTYGIQFTNDNNVVTLDSEFSRLVVLQRGRYQGGAAFSATITSAEPPLVFVRPDATTTFSYASITGSPGAWTGFSFLGGGTGNFFVAAYSSSPTANYGIRIWDGASKLLFDSGTPCAQFTRTISAWTYLGSTPTGQGTSRSVWTAPSPLNTGDFMLINNIGMDVASTTNGRSAKLYCTWDYANNGLSVYIVGVANSTSFFVPVVFAKPIT